MAERVATVWGDLLRRPDKYLVEHWNWKSAVTSAVVRGGIYFATNLSAGFHAATVAMLVEFSYRTLLSGACGSVTQALRQAEPRWAATLSAMAALPIFGHSVELAIHSLRGTPRLPWSFAASVGFTILATLFNLYAMRRGVLVTGAGSRTLTQDITALPRVIAGFAAAGPIAVWKFFRSGP